MTTRDRHGAAPGPVLALPRGQSVEIEQDVPLGLLAAVAVEHCRPPQAARMRRVLPEIENPHAAPGDQRDVVGAIEDCREGVSVGHEAGVAEPRQCPCILRLDPSERALTVDFFEPQIRVVVGRV